MSIRAAVAVSENIEQPYQAGVALADQILDKLSLKSRAIGILFVGIEFDPHSLLRGVRERLSFPIVGCTTASEANSEGYFEDSASLLVITGDDLAIGVGVGEGLTRDPEGAVKRAIDAARAMLGPAQPALAVTFPDCALSVSADYVLRLLVEGLGRDVPLTGGLPGDGLHFKRTFQFVNDRVFSDSVPVALIGGAVKAVVVTRSGWVPMGRRARATKVNGNVLLEVDGQPAAEYFKRYISAMAEPSVIASHPVAILDQSMDDEAARHFIIRSPFFYEEDSGAITYNGDIPLNAQIQLARGSQDDILNGARDAARTLKKRAGGRPLDALLCFSCAGRKLMLGLDTKREIEILLGELAEGSAAPPPVNGFYTYGEIGAFDSSRRDLNSTKFHNTTLVLCGLMSVPAPAAAITPSPPSAIEPASGDARLTEILAENEKLKQEVSRLNRAVQRMERRAELMDKVWRGKEQVNAALYSDVERLSQELEAEKRKVDSLVTNMLPSAIAERLKASGGTIAESFEQATVLFADLVGFTALSEKLLPEKLVTVLNDLFSAFDDLAERYHVEKIKTIGDAYMVAGGIPEPRRDHALLVAAMSLDMQNAVSDFARRLNLPLTIRVGIHSGPVIAGVIGKKKFVYDLWGDTVNTAARLQSHGIPGRIQVSEATYSRLCDDFELEERGLVPVKDKGNMRTWLLVARKPTMSVRGVPFFF
jgi:class 3 adenylate cyclase